MTDALGRQLMQHIKKNKVLMMQGDDEGLLSNIHYWISTGCWPLDLSLGGGIPGGRLAELYGEESTGKSLLGLNIIASVQRMGGVALLLDAESTMSMEIASVVGVNTDDLIIGYPNTIEEVYSQIIEFLEAKRKLDKEQNMIIPSVIVWDSVASTTSEGEVNSVETKGLGSFDVAPHARAMSKMLRILPRELSRSRVTGIFINQTRDKIGISFGDKTSTAGGKALKFYSSVRIKLSVTGQYKISGTEPIGIEVKSVIAKNKVGGRPFGVTKFPILFGAGVDNAMACLWRLRDAEIIRTSGPWLYMDNPTGGDEIRFQRSTWPEIFSQYEDVIHNLVMNQAVEYVSEEKDLDEEDMAGV